MNPQMPALESLVAEALDCVERGDEEALRCLRAAHPAHVEALDRRLERLRSIAALPLPPERAVLRIGSCRILHQLGAGGMGCVYLGEQDRPLRRLVAVKVLKKELLSADGLARFRAERSAMAKMQHPAIATIYEAGEDEGNPYFAMEFVPGDIVTVACDQRRLPVRDRVALVALIADAIQHAHQNGILHRDLKPSNVIGVDFDGTLVPKVIDFGLAKVIDRELDPEDASPRTQIGQILGTPQYMSPEQARGDIDHIDTRTDVYALGVLLYELLIGRAPLDLIERGSLFEMLTAIDRLDGPRPSVHLAQMGEPAARVAELRGTNVQALRRAIVGDLDWIVAKALAHDPDRRYASASEFAADLRRALAHEPVLAGPESKLYRLRKFERRHRLPVAAGLLLVASLVGGLVATHSQYLRAQANGLSSQKHLTYFDALVDADEIQRLIGRAEEEIWPASLACLPQIRAWMDAAGRLILREDLLRQNLRQLRDELGEKDTSGSQVGWRFRAERFRYAHDALEQVLARLEDLLPLLADARRNELWALEVEYRSLRECDAAWSKARAELAVDRRFAGFVLPDLIGLVPIGPDPATGLQEFALASCRDEQGRRAIDGSIRIEETTGLVFVLVPGGHFDMGSAPGGPGVPNGGPFPEVRREEQPVHRVELAPFLISKYEMTQGQWLRLAGSNPSKWHPGEMQGGMEIGVAPHHLAHPVGGLSRLEAVRVLRRAGLVLPTEAQWEYVARAGTTTPWWWGDSREGIVEGVLAANFADQDYCVSVSGDPEEFLPWHDGYKTTAPVDTMRPNPLGLHHVLGNLWEWVSEDFCNGYDGTLTLGGDARREGGQTKGSGILRGGCFISSPQGKGYAAHRVEHPAHAANAPYGVRPVFPLPVAPRS